VICMEPLLVKLARSKKAGRIMAGVLKFFVSMFVMTIVCTNTWDDFLDGKVYMCTDGPTGYFTPGDWVHNWDGHPVAVVHQITPPHDMSDPDQIKAGWSVAGLWCLWFSFFGISLVVSILLAWVPWIPRLERSIVNET